VDLDSLFAPEGSNVRPAQSLFTNRTTECASFLDARERVLAGLPEYAADPADLSRGRRNVLCFYGMGGMGKSSLSRELQRRAAEPVAGRVTLVSRTDFHRPDAFSLEQQLLQLRLDLLHRDFPARAFDLALGIYWEKAHPNEQLADYLRRRGVAGTTARRTGLADQVETVVSEALDAMGTIRSGRRILTLLSDAFLDRVRRRKFMGTCPFFAPIVEEPEPERMLPYLAALLGWDLMQAQQRRGIEVVVFWDTWERLQQPGGPLGGTEELLARIAYLMPTALFVVTGRNRLTWADERSQHTMRYGGPERWPGLADTGEEPRQHLLGALSEQDRLSYLTARLRDVEQPGVDLVIAKIADGSVGLPLYLDLAATRVDQLAAQGRPLDPAEFGGPLEELVVRVMSGLSDGERRLLRAAAVRDAFDADVLRESVRRVVDQRPSDAELSRFLAYDFVLRDPHRALPCSLHPRLRDSVRACDHVSPDPWSEREWSEATQGALTVLERRLAVTARDEPEGLAGDGARAVWGVEAFPYAAALGVAPEWLLPVVLTQRSQGDWAQLEQQAALPHDPGSGFAPLAAAMRALVAAKTGDSAGAAARYRAVLDHPMTTGQLRDFTTLQLAEVAVLDGAADEGTAALRALVAERSVYEGTAAQHLAYLAWRAGRYAEALAWASANELDPIREVHALDLHGLVALELGDFTLGEERLRKAWEVAKRTATPSHVATESRHLARLVALVDPVTGEALAREAAEYNRASGSPAGESQSLVALALALSGQGRLEEAADAVRESVAVLGDSDRTSAAFPLVAQVHLACRRGAADASREAVRGLGALSDHLVWAAIGAVWHEAAFGEALPEAGRLDALSLPDGMVAFQHRWRAVAPQPA